MEKPLSPWTSELGYIAAAPPLRITRTKPNLKVIVGSGRVALNQRARHPESLKCTRCLREAVQLGAALAWREGG